MSAKKGGGGASVKGTIGLSLGKIRKGIHIGKGGRGGRATFEEGGGGIKAKRRVNWGEKRKLLLLTNQNWGWSHHRDQ